MDEISNRSARPGVLYDPISWDSHDLMTLVDSEEKLLFASMLFSKIITDESNAYAFFIAGIHNYIEVLAEYNTHTRELSQMLLALFDVVQRHTDIFIKVASTHHELIENHAQDLRNWREHMGQHAYTYAQIHKLHEPTMSAILQIIDLIEPGHQTHNEEGDGLELF